MKNFTVILLLFIGTCASAQTYPQSNYLNGKYQFIYNDEVRIVEFFSNTNTFIEYDENLNQLTDGTYNLVKNIFYLVPVNKTSLSQVSIPVNFKIMGTLNNKTTVLLNSTEVTDRRLNIFKL